MRNDSRVVQTKWQLAYQTDLVWADKFAFNFVRMEMNRSKEGGGMSKITEQGCDMKKNII